MDSSGRKPWVVRVILVGLAYAVVGVVLAALSDRLASNYGQVVMWRRAAWVVSSVVYGIHVAYEHFRLANPPRRTALHAGMSAAIGAFGLAVAANLHEYWVSPNHRGLLVFALLAWPALAGVPAFIIALVAAYALALVRPRN